MLKEDDLIQDAGPGDSKCASKAICSRQKARLYRSIISEWLPVFGDNCIHTERSQRQIKSALAAALASYWHVVVQRSEDEFEVLRKSTTSPPPPPHVNKGTIMQEVSLLDQWTWRSDQITLVQVSCWGGIGLADEASALGEAEGTSCAGAT